MGDVAPVYPFHHFNFLEIDFFQAIREPFDQRVDGRPRPLRDLVGLATPGGTETAML
jgi:hypothetical protein